MPDIFDRKGQRLIVLRAEIAALAERVSVEILIVRQVGTGDADLQFGFLILIRPKVGAGGQFVGLVGRDARAGIVAIGKGEKTEAVP